MKIKTVYSKRGMALYLVLGVLVVTSIIASMFVNMMLSQTKLSTHQISRTHAFFAARLGMNYAIEMLSRNDTEWPPTGTYNRTICKSGCNKTEPNLPSNINNITISVGTPNTTTGIRPLNISVNYFQDI
jgi:Tfp pilus assembly protein PilX